MKVHQLLIILDILMALSKKLTQSLWSVYRQTQEFSRLAHTPGYAGKPSDIFLDDPQALGEFFQQAHQDVKNYQYLVYFHLCLTHLILLFKTNLRRVLESC